MGREALPSGSLVWSQLRLEVKVISTGQPLWSELMLSGSVQFHIQRIKNITTAMGCAGGGNSWKCFVSCFLLPCTQILAWNKDIYTGISKANLTNDDCMKLAFTSYWFKTRMTCLGITGTFLPLCNPVTLVWSNKPRDDETAKPLVTLTAECAFQHYYCSHS